MRDVVVTGVGMTRFGKQPDRTVKSLATEAVEEALADADVKGADIGIIYYANATSGLLQGQESTRGQHALVNTDLPGIPLVNVENACASGATALNQAWLAVGSGHVDVALAIGVEKLHIEDKRRAFSALSSALDQDRLEEIHADLGTPAGVSVFMDIYARWAGWYLGRSDATVEDFARVAVKNHRHGSSNPKAQYGTLTTVQEVLAARQVSGPLTVPMCAPMSDGAAAVIVTTPEIATVHNTDAVRLLATIIATGRPGTYGELVPRAARQAYDMAAVGPRDLDVIECHDAAAPAELIVMEEIGLCPTGDASHLLRAGKTTLGGDQPVNPSGGLQSRGHPAGATGLAQVVELVDQLRGRAGHRQVEHARLALAENAGGYLGPDAAVAAITILGK